MCSKRTLAGRFRERKIERCRKNNRIPIQMRWEISCREKRIYGDLEVKALVHVGDASLLGGRCDTACLVEPDVTRTLISSRSDAVCLCCRYSSVCPSAGAASGRYRKILRFVRRRIKYQGSVMYEPYFPAASIRLTVLVCHVRIVKFTRIASPKLPLLLPLLKSRSRFSGGSNCGIGTRSFFQLSP